MAKFAHIPCDNGTIIIYCLLRADTVGIDKRDPDPRKLTDKETFTQALLIQGHEEYFKKFVEANPFKFNALKYNRPTNRNTQLVNDFILDYEGNLNSYKDKM